MNTVYEVMRRRQYVYVRLCYCFIIILARAEIKLFINIIRSYFNNRQSNGTLLKTTKFNAFHVRAPETETIFPTWLTERDFGSNNTSGYCQFALLPTDDYRTQEITDYLGQHWLHISTDVSSLERWLGLYKYLHLRYRRRNSLETNKL